MIEVILSLVLIAVFVLTLVTIFLVRFAVTNQAFRQAVDNALIPLYVSMFFTVVGVILSFVMNEMKK